MNARRLRVPKPVKWIVTVILVLAAGALLGGCHKRKVFVLHEPGPYVARHGRRPRVVLVDRGRDRRHREEARHERRERPDKRRSDRRQDDRPRPRRR